MRKMSAVTDRLLGRFLDGGTARAAERVCVPDGPDCEICQIIENGKVVLEWRVCYDTTGA